MADLPIMCYNADFGRSALKGVCINTGVPLKNYGALKLCSLGIGGVSDPRYTILPDMCHHVTFGSSATRDERIK